MIENKHQHDVVLVVPNGDEELRVNFHGVTPTMMPLIHALDAAQDMLKVLDWWVNYSPEDHDGVSMTDNDRLFEAAVAALAKARGAA